MRTNTSRIHRRIIVLLSVMLAIASFAQPAFAATTLRGSVTKTGSVNEALATQLCTVTADCYFYSKLRLKALAATDTGKTSKTVSFTLWERWMGDSDYIFLEELSASSPLKASKGQYWPGGSDASQYKTAHVKTHVHENYYYQTQIYSNVPSTIQGYYESWLSSKSNGS